MIPADFSLLDLIAILLMFTSWFAYPWILKLVGIAPLNSQLGVARKRWVEQIASRAGNPFDAILLGHVVHSVAFFGSATLIVLAGIFSIFVKLDDIYQALSGFEMIRNTSFGLFIIIYSILAIVLTVCFFSFTYTLRKLLYSLALIGALPDKPESEQQLAQMVSETTIVITESLKTFNFGIRGYYYAIACIALFVSPLACIATTLIITVILVFRQLKTPTSKAIKGFTKQL
jgi:uncharacterized membrane protein